MGGANPESREAIAILKKLVADGLELKKIRGATVPVQIASGKVVHLVVINSRSGQGPQFPRFPNLAVVCAASAGRSSGPGISKAQEKQRRRINDRAHTKHAKKNIKLGRAAGYGNRDGSKGGMARNTHGGLSETTKKSPLIRRVIQARRVRQRITAVKIEVYKATAHAFVAESAKLPDGVPDSHEELEERAEELGGKARDALKDTNYMLARPEGSVDFMHDLEGHSTLDQPAGKVHQWAAVESSFGGGAPSVAPIAEARAARTSAGKSFLKPAQLGEVLVAVQQRAEQAKETQRGKRPRLLRYGGKDHLLYKYLCNKSGLKPLEDLNVLRCLYLVFGRCMNGHRMPGSNKMDGIELNMESLMYVFGEAFKHNALSDCVDQTMVWFAILDALRELWGLRSC